MSDETLPPAAPPPPAQPPVPPNAPPKVKGFFARVVSSLMFWGTILPGLATLGIIRGCSGSPSVVVEGDVYPHHLPRSISSALDDLDKLARKNDEEPLFGCYEFKADAKRGAPDCVRFVPKEQKGRSEQVTAIAHTVMIPKEYRSQGRVKITNDGEKEIVNVKLVLPHDRGEFIVTLPGESKNGLYQGAIAVGSLSPGSDAIVDWWGLDDNRADLRPSRDERIACGARRGERPPEAPTTPAGAAP